MHHTIELTDREIAIAEGRDPDEVTASDEEGDSGDEDEESDEDPDGDDQQATDDEDGDDESNEQDAKEVGWTASDKRLAAKYGLTEEDVATIHFYTQECRLYICLNGALGGWGDGGVQALPHYLPFAKLLISVLDKLPAVQAEVYRGVRGVPR